MKKLLFLIALIPIFTFAQDKIKIPFVDGRVQFDTVLVIKNKSAKELYASTKLIISELYKSGKAAIDIADSEGLFITVKGVTKYPLTDFLGTLYVNLDHSIKFQFKDGRMKVTMNDLVVSTVPFEKIAVESKGYRYSEKIRQQHNTHVIEFWNQLNQTITDKLKNTEGENW